MSVYVNACVLACLPACARECVRACVRVAGGECHLPKKKKAAGYVSSYQHKCKTFAGESTVGRGNHDIQLSGALVAESHW